MYAKFLSEIVRAERVVSILKGSGAVLIALLMLLTLGSGGVAADTRAGVSEWYLTGLDHHDTSLNAGAYEGDGENEVTGLSLLGQLSFEVLSSDVWAHGDFAYVGSLDCSTGVKVADISDPTDPTLVTTLLGHPEGAVLDIKVAEIETDSFDGVLLANSIEPCETGALGFDLWDVTDPASAIHLSTFETGPVHNLFLFQQDDRAFVIQVVPFSEVFGAVAGLPGDTATDVAIIEVTDPTSPTLVGTWNIGRDAGLAFGSPFFAGIPGLPPGSDCAPPPGTPALCRGDDFPGVFAHDVWVDEDGEVAFLAYWDAGLILLDIEDPSKPTLIGHAVEPPTFGSDEGNAHVAVPADDDLVLVLDEDFTPGPWGFLRVFDSDDEEEPVQVGAFATDNALFVPPPFCCFTAHNVIVVDDLAFASWYTDGIRVVDISDPDDPREVASFSVSLGVAFTLFWGVFVIEDFEGDDDDDERLLVLGSDIFTGLYLLEFTEGDEGDDD